MKKSGKLAYQVVNSNNAVNSLPKVQISQGTVALCEKNYDGEPILTVFSVSGKELYHRCFNSVYYVRTVSQSDNDAVFVNNYCCQIIAEQF